VDRPPEGTHGQNSAHGGQQRAAPPGHGDGCFGDEDAEDEARGGARDTVELVLTEDGRAHHRHGQRSDDSKG